MAIDGIAVSDFKGLHDLKIQAQDDAKKALPAVAKQFEAIFLQSMLKTMRMGQHFLDESSPFRGKHQETFQTMLDGQYASNISEGRGIGLATMLAKQLEGSVGTTEKKPLLSMTSANHISMPMKPSPLAITPEVSAKPPETSQSMDDFVKSIWPYARQAANLLGLDPKILVAQAALETGWGQFIAKDVDGSSSNNLFNIKSTSGSENSSIKVKTTEFVADTPIKMTASFKKYPTVGHSFKDYVSLIKGNNRYEEAVANAQDPQQYIKALSEAGYATDPNYANKIMSIYNGTELQQSLDRSGYKTF